MRKTFAITAIAVALMILGVIYAWKSQRDAVGNQPTQPEQSPVPTRSWPQAKKRPMLASSPNQEGQQPVQFVLPIRARVGEGTVGRSSLTNVGPIQQSR